MGSLFRSEEMALCQMFLHSEAAYECISELGELGLVQFTDLNPDVNVFQRKFVNEVRRCDEMERKLRYFEKEMKKDGIPMFNIGDSPKAPQPKKMIIFEATLEKIENELLEVNRNVEALKQNYFKLIEMKHILRNTQVFFDEREDSVGVDAAESVSGDVLMSSASNLLLEPVQHSVVAGVILRERLPAFERMLWRVCHGNVFLRQAMIEIPFTDPTSGDNVFKSVFVIFFQGDQLKTRVKKVCEGFHATIHQCPEAQYDRREMAINVMMQIEDLTVILSQTENHRHRILRPAAKNLKNWLVKVRKIKAIYHTLNMFNFNVMQKYLIAECWVPVPDIEKIQLALLRGSKRSGLEVPPILNRMQTLKNPPTYNRTNKFTKAFQGLIDAYGIASYREMNPAPYTIITFPFLFAVMFGDFGHGTIMALFALWMILNEKSLAAQKTNNEIWKIFFGGRYIVFLMGLFSIYTGLIYNDIFSKSLNIFGSNWINNYNASTISSNKVLQLSPKTDYLNTSYLFGMDPAWQVAPLNKIIFQNSYKMKISIIFGVIHMIFGVSMSFMNYLYKDKISILIQFIPQMVFLLCLFFYMTLLMFIKWVKYSTTATDFKLTEKCAPSVLIMFINMLLPKPHKPKMDPIKDPCACDPYMFNEQEIIQKALLIAALLTIPIMLLGKPFILLINPRRRRRNLRQIVPNVNGNQENMPVVIHENHEQHADGHGGEEMSEIFITQGIHTIEYVLGSVSHTASYLRLWALSLAHAQLAEVLWNMVLQRALKQEGWYSGIILWATFSFWAVLTVGILVLMEGLSAFLHTLRLHWVEFQSKFYKGLGYAFTPFSFNIILEQGNEPIEGE